MFLDKNNSTIASGNNLQRQRNNYEFSRATKKNNVNNSTLPYTKSGNQTTSNQTTSNQTTSNQTTSNQTISNSTTGNSSSESKVARFHKLLDDAKKGRVDHNLFKSVSGALSNNLNLGNNSKRANRSSDIFDSLNNELNNNIKKINNNSNRMIRKKPGCGCGGKKK